MKRFMKRKVVVVASTVALVLGIGGAAFAYFTSQGTGTGTGVVGNAGGWIITASSPSGYLYPEAPVGAGPNIETTGYSVENSGGGNQVLTSVTISVANSDGSAWSSQTDATEPACTAADFSVDAGNPGDAYVDTSLAGTYVGGQTNYGTFTLEMIDNGLNQDNCQGLTVPVYFTTTPPVASNANLSVEPSDGSGGFGPNPTFLVDPTVTLGTPVTLTVTAEQPNAELASGSITVTYNDTFLSFTSASGDATCTAGATVGVTASETCSYTDLGHGDSSKPFNFATLQAGATSATAVVTIGANGSATESFPLNIS